MIINHNMNALNAHRNMNINSTSQGKAMEKLNSGMRINRASDDAAGLAIFEKMRSQIRGLNQASRNAQDGISMIQTAEGALLESQSISQRMRELAVQSSNGTYTDEDRELINREFQQLKYEVDGIAVDTEFNGKKLLDGTLQGQVIRLKGGVEQPNTGNGVTNVAGTFHEPNQHILPFFGEGSFEVLISVDSDKNATISISDITDPDNKYIMDSTVIKIPSDDNNMNVTFELYDKEFNMNFNMLTREGTTLLRFHNEALSSDNGMVLQIGANNGQTIDFNINNMRARELGLAKYNVLTQENSEKAIVGVSDAISKISGERARLGSIQNRLEHTIASTDNTAENLQASESRIRDVDMAKQMMNLTKLNVLQQASQAMLSQANQAPQQVLQILR